MVDLGYVIILVETHDKKVKLYGSPAEKADLEVADEILEINGQSLDNSNHTDVIAHIHNCIKSRTICLRVKRRTGNKLAKELAENSHVQDAFVIAVEQQAKERLERLSALRKIKPVDMTKLSQQLCESPPASIGGGGDGDVGSEAGGPSGSVAGDEADPGPVYSAPMAQLGSTQNLCPSQSDPPPPHSSGHKYQKSPAPATSTSGGNNSSKNKRATDGSVSSRPTSAGGGYVTDEEIELQHTITPPNSATSTSAPPNPISSSPPPAANGQMTSAVPNDHSQPGCIKSPSKEVLIGGDNNPSRRSSRSSMGNYEGVHNGFNGGTNGHQNSIPSAAVPPRARNSLQPTQEVVGEMIESNGHTALGPTNSLKSVVDVADILQCLENLGSVLGGGGSRQPGLNKEPEEWFDSTRSLVTSKEFGRLLGIHNTIQTVQCFHTPPDAMCCDARNLVRECMLALQSSTLPEAAEVLDILHQVEFESLFYTHDKLAERQAASPWEQSVADMWAKDRGGGGGGGHTNTSYQVSEAGAADAIGKVTSSTGDPSSSSSSGGGGGTLTSSQQHHHHQSEGGGDPPQQQMTPETSRGHLHRTAAVNLNPSTSASGGNHPHSQSSSEDVGGGSKGNTALQRLSSNSGGSSDVTRVVKILKQNEPLGATVRNEGDKVVIGRVVKGGAAERSGQLSPGDEVLEVNGLKLKGKSVHDICDTLCRMTGTLTFVIIPKSQHVNLARNGSSVSNSSSLNNRLQSAPHNNNYSGGQQHANDMEEQGPKDQVFHYRAHFSYHPDDDLYIPCHELGISFQRGDILHVINSEDKNWWQAYRDGEWTQTLAGLIPSLALQQHRMSLQRQKRDQDLKEQREQDLLRNTHGSPAKKKGAGSSLLCAKKTSKRKRVNSPFKRVSERFDITPYEEMALYYPQANQRRPLILVGPPSIGRHELRLRLLEDTSRFAAAVPHTSRAKGETEIDGQDYNFVTRAQFEEMASSGLAGGVAGVSGGNNMNVNNANSNSCNSRFVEHGEYDKQYYGTSLDAVRTVINSGKICVLNLQPSSLMILHESDLKPYVVFLTPPTIQTYRQQKAKYGEQYKEEEFRDSVSIAQEMEDHYGHYFDSVIPFDDVDYVFQQLMYEINLLEREPQWVPAKWVQQVPPPNNTTGNTRS